ncbi:proton myo-inositol cotransporter-like protein [Dinothrombium tinctorium]|uniref:Proton myo-inositol cotransporter-like protein n=1 Tax=Dinothrombium tinctorium TaxID=1965070 RepID=A0A3S3P273_9ACAR|nr:proton myo-inositol cotransporter-like protein [Dinothrombium tinctorium]
MTEVEVCEDSATVVAGIFSSNEKTGWRFMVGIAAIPAAVQLVGFIFTPESPRYLVRRGKLDKALKLLRKIQPKNPKVEHQIELIRKNSEECESKASIFKMLRRICKTRTVRKALFVGSCLHIFQQMVGINTVMYYTATIIKNAGFKNKSTAIWLSSIVAFVPVAVTFLSFYLLEKIGRRITFLISLVGTVFSLFALAVTFRMIDSSQPNTLWLNNTEALDNNNASLNCMEANRKEDCSRCTSFVECGICYKIESVDSVKMDCLPIDAKAEVRSAFGMCKNGTDNEQKIFWEPEDCPTLQKTLYSILLHKALLTALGTNSNKVLDTNSKTI